jgi:hypothetical protein
MESSQPQPAAAERIVTVDVPLQDLTPVRRRTARARIFERLEANIRAVGLIEPLLVFQQNGQRFILDGYLRYQVLMGMGVRSAPCIVIDTLDIYTPNRQVNYLSHSQYRVMIKRALAIVPEDQLTAALGIARLRSQIPPSMRETLCPEVIRRVEEERLTMKAAKRLMHVNVERQQEILSLSDQAKDTSGPFIRTQIMRTKPEHRVQRPEKASPWNRGAATRQKLVDRLVEVENKHDFFQGVYRQYAADLVKLAIYVRQVINVRDVRDYLAKHHAETLKLFRQIVQHYDEQAAAG